MNSLIKEKRWLNLRNWDWNWKMIPDWWMDSLWPILKLLLLMKHGNRCGERWNQSATIIMRWLLLWIRRHKIAISLSVSVFMMMAWDSGMNSHCRRIWIILWLRKNIPSLLWREIIRPFGFPVIMIRRNTIIPSPDFLKFVDYCKGRLLETLLKPLSRQQVCKLLCRWKRMMAYISTCMKLLWLIIPVCIWTLMIGTWFLNRGWHRTHKEIKDICKHLVVLLGAR